jgi:NADPH-dependent 7-cyano-7-deazaguanine reductase QueF
MTVYRLRATALCPADGSRDHYDVEIHSIERINAEELKAWFDDFANRPIFQEDLAIQTMKVFRCECFIAGMHPAPVEIVT